jgi:hypothetical protein
MTASGISGQSNNIYKLLQGPQSAQVTAQKKAVSPQAAPAADADGDGDAGGSKPIPSSAHGTILDVHA